MARKAKAASPAEIPAVSQGFTEDSQLGGRIRLLQPAEGYRAAIDPVLLAAFVPAEAGDRVLDVGAGVGAASLCLAARVPGCRIIGLEIQSELAALAADNVERNDMAGRVEIYAGTLAVPPQQIASGGFSYVMTNPPFNEQGSSSPHAGKDRANKESDLDLETWLKLSLRLLRPKGILTLIHRADRLDDLLQALHGRAGDIVLFPLWPKAGRPAKRILVRARKQSAAPVRLLPGLVLHEEDGRYTQAAQAILSDGAAISI